MPLDQFGDILLDQTLQEKRSPLFPDLPSLPEPHSSSKAAEIWNLLTTKLHPENFKRRAGHPAWGADGEAQTEDLSVPHTDPVHLSPWLPAENASCAAWEQKTTNSYQVKDKQLSFSTAAVQQAKRSTQQDKRHLCGSSAKAAWCWRQQWGKLRLIQEKKPNPVFPKLSGDAGSWCSQLFVTGIFQICWRKNNEAAFLSLLPVK